LTVRTLGSNLKVELSLPGSQLTMDDNHAYSLFTVDQIIRQLSLFTAEQCSLAWSPQPPFQSTGAGDCRLGGNCGLDFNRGTARARWIQARHRFIREQKRLQVL
jgi:hypothetical protein